MGAVPRGQQSRALEALRLGARVAGRGAQRLFPGARHAGDRRQRSDVAVLPGFFAAPGAARAVEEPLHKPRLSLLSLLSLRRIPKKPGTGTRSLQQLSL